MRRLRSVLWPAGAVLGVVAEWSFYGWGSPRYWVPDLVTGWTLIACGLIGWSRRPESRSGPLMAATGFAWFAGNFASWAFYLHWGPLVQLVLTYPRGRLAGRLDRAGVAAGYVAAVALPLLTPWRRLIPTILLATLIVLVAAREYLGAIGGERRERLAALEATAFLGAVLAGVAALRLAFLTQEARSATLLAYEVSLCALAIGLSIGLLRAPWERAAVGDLVVELGEERSGTLRDALARELGDPTLEVGYWLPEARAYVDYAGRPLDLSRTGSGRRVTHIDRGGQAVAVLVHDSAVLDDPGLIDALESAAGLAASNARLQAEVRAQIVELQASRRRLVRAGDEERRRLEERLRKGAERRLGDVVYSLERARERARDRQTSERIERAQEQLARTVAELHELARGLHPGVLTEMGLAGALASLVERSPIPVGVAVPGHRLPEELEVAAYFVCSEALANVAKYASASNVGMRVTASDGVVRVVIVDDGVGGADPARGTGLRGLADRVEALGGRLLVESPRGSGTRVTAEIPLG